jgi:hypothetical protein
MDRLNRSTSDLKECQLIACQDGKNNDGAKAKACLEQAFLIPYFKHMYAFICASWPARPSWRILWRGASWSFLTVIHGPAMMLVLA